MFTVLLVQIGLIKHISFIRDGIRSNDSLFPVHPVYLGSWGWVGLQSHCSDCKIGTTSHKFSQGQRRLHVYPSCQPVSQTNLQIREDMACVHSSSLVFIILPDGLGAAPSPWALLRIYTIYFCLQGDYFRVRRVSAFSLSTGKLNVNYLHF